MNIVLAVLLTLHGFAHLPGVLVPLRLATLKDMPYGTTILAGAVDIGDAGMRVMGILWLVSVLAFIASGGASLAQLSWWRTAATAAVALSLLLCILAWPVSRVGVFVNVAIIALLIITRSTDWLS